MIRCYFQLQYTDSFYKSQSHFGHIQFPLQAPRICNTHKSTKVKIKHIANFGLRRRSRNFCIFLHAGSLSRIFSTEKETRTYKIVQQGHLVWLICLWFITRSTKSSKLLYSLFMICIFPRWGTPLPAWKDMLMLMEESFPLSLILVRPLVRLKMSYLNHIYRCYFSNW